MRVTVAICTWNRADLLDQTLTRMCAMQIPEQIEWELLVVNNNCTDNTEEVVSRHSRTLPLKYVLEPNPGLSHARNKALSECRSDIIAWTDDDVMVDEEWLSSLVEAAARNPEAAGFGGPIDPWFPVPLDPDLASAFPALAKGFCGLDHAMGEGPVPVGVPIWGANMAFRTASIESMLFDTHRGARPSVVRSRGKDVAVAIGLGEEEKFVADIRARGGTIVWVPDMRVRHYVDPVRMTLGYLTAFYEEVGRTSVRDGGVIEGNKIYGLPFWLLRQWIVASSRYALCRAFLRRADALAWLRQRSYLGGMLRECRVRQLHL